MQLILKAKKLMAVFLGFLMLVSVACQSVSLFSKPVLLKLPQFKAGYNYKRLVINHQQEAWVLSALTENWPIKENTVWFSRDNSVLRFAQGRLTGFASALPRRQWQETVSSYPNWKEVLAGKPHNMRRCVTDYPNNKENHCAAYQVALSQKPPKQHQFVGDATTLTWVSEKTNHNDQANLWFAFKAGMTQPVYGQLCIDKSTCITWQNW